ncbi:hypothetical protein LCGC14_1308920 [marine sediment metagenome]|uniref:Uncharacterized protein n=1 Tax=marine sediment metagenome TaxID=412755 RepID=A0A0F9KNF1_9ZZZZ|nr:MAG: hypothetical protein Lokiarch_27230 [Candidatus Lokiarchaeum sp. GC14_75]
MVQSIKFRSSAEKELEADYHTVNISPEQRRSIRVLSEILSKRLPLSSMAIQGNAMFTMRDWQEKNHEIAAKISEMPMEKKLQVAKEITDLGKERMKKLLSFPEKHKELIDKAYDEAWKIYVEQLAKYRVN